MNQPKIVGPRKGQCNLPKAAALALAFAATLALAAVGAPADAANECTHTAAPTANVEGIANGLPNEAVLCLRGGVYASDPLIKVKNDRLTVRSYPGEVAEIRGSTEVNAPDVTLEGMKHRGQYGNTVVGAAYDPNEVKTWPAIEVNADRVTVNNSPLIENQSPTDPKNHSGQAIQVANDGFVLTGSHVGAFGEDDSGNNHQHAVYLNGDDGVIRANSFSPGGGNGDRCLQMYTDTDRTLIEGNVFYRCNDVAIHFSGRNGDAANDNRVLNNVAAYTDEDDNVNTFTGQTKSSVFSGNVVRDICAVTRMNIRDSPEGSGIQPNMPGASVSGVVVADPQITGSFASGTARVTNPACAAKLPAGSRFRP